MASYFLFLFTAGQYVPLDDSQHYLAGLERKLAQVQGRGTGRRQAESRRLIDALASSRSLHTNELIQQGRNDSEGASDDLTAEDSDHPAHTTAAVDPQGSGLGNGREVTEY